MICSRWIVRFFYSTIFIYYDFNCFVAVCKRSSVCVECNFLLFGFRGFCIFVIPMRVQRCGAVICKVGYSVCKCYRFTVRFTGKPSDKCSVCFFLVFQVPLLLSSHLLQRLLFPDYLQKVLHLHQM